MQVLLVPMHCIPWLEKSIETYREIGERQREDMKSLEISKYLQFERGERLLWVIKDYFNINPEQDPRKDIPRKL